MTRSETPNYITNPNWENPCKILSRQETILFYYRELFGRDKIPDNKQYWTLCGAHYKTSPFEKIDGELGQLVKNGLIEESQFFGVDRCEEIVKNNQKLYPKSNWIAGDFLQTMKKYAAHKKFNPEVINYDSTSECKFGGKYVSKIMRFLDLNFEGRVLLFSNFILKSGYNWKHQFDELDALGGVLGSYRMPDHWSILPTYYSYQGGASLKSKSIMGTFVFVKGEHNFRNFEITSGRNLVLEIA